MEVMDKRGKSTQFLKLQSTTSYILHENEFKIDHILCHCLLLSLSFILVI